MSGSKRFEQAIAALTPEARTALVRALRGGLGDSPREAVELAADLINTDVELVSVPLDEREQRRLVARASELSTRAPVARIEDGGAFALLVSAEHLWALADRVDELEVALGVLATACVLHLGGRAALEALLAELEGGPAA
jgi:hypothetical protein